MGRMNAHPKGQSVLTGSSGPAIQDIPSGTHLCGIPVRLPAAVIQIQVIMMVRQGHEILRPCLFIQGDQTIGIPFPGFPFMDHILESKAGGMRMEREGWGIYQK